MNITQRLGGFIASTAPDAITSEATEQARRAILDTLGVTLAGSREPASRIVADVVRKDAGRAEATALGHDFRVPAAAAALVNGTSGHALDYDDVSWPMRGHPSVPLLPAAVAVSERLDASGREIVEAFVVGFEVECKMGRAIGGPHYALGWHATSTFGTIGAAAACARLLRLDADHSATALAIASSLASGLRQNFGTMTKPLHAGWAARNGVTAAELAQRGFTADASALEGGTGFFHAASGGADIDPLSAVRNLGDPWEIVSPGIGVKLYPCCYATHRAIDAALEVRGALAGKQINHIEVRVTSGTLMPLIDRTPTTGLEGKFSLRYCVAAALLDGPPRLASFTDVAVRRPAACSLMERVSIVEDGLQMEFPIEGIAEVRIEASGADVSARVERPRGDPQQPLSAEELASKFYDCASLAIADDRVREVSDLVTRLDELPKISDLVRAVAG